MVIYGNELKTKGNKGWAGDGMESEHMLVQFENAGFNRIPVIVKLDLSYGPT